MNIFRENIDLCNEHGAMYLHCLIYRMLTNRMHINCVWMYICLCLWVYGCLQCKYINSDFQLTCIIWYNKFFKKNISRLWMYISYSFWLKTINILNSNHFRVILTLIIWWYSKSWVPFNIYTSLFPLVMVHVGCWNSQPQFSLCVCFCKTTSDFAGETQYINPCKEHNSNYFLD